MNIKDNRRVRMTKKLIKEALIDLMEKDNISRITVKEICALADINRSTFYLHFCDQYALLEEVENDIISQTPRINLYEKKDVYPVLVDFFKFIQENKRVYLILFKSTNGNSFRSKLIDKVFGKDENKKEWISNMELSNALHFKMLMSAFGGATLVEKWIFDEINSSPEELAKSLSDFVKK